MKYIALVNTDFHIAGCENSANSVLLQTEQHVTKLVIQMKHSDIDSTTYWKQKNLCNIKETTKYGSWFSIDRCRGLGKGLWSFMSACIFFNNYSGYLDLQTGSATDQLFDFTGLLSWKCFSRCLNIPVRKCKLKSITKFEKEKMCHTSHQQTVS